MRPVSILASRPQKIVTVHWEDGHTSIYPFSLLRAGCPCAECRRGHENMSRSPGAEIFSADLPDSPATCLANLNQTGSYAIQPVWEDGHDAGIFPWSYLRALCPCPQCRK